MYARFSTAFGTPFVEEGTGELLGLLTGILIHPDTGKIEGFFVHAPAIFGSSELYCSTMDILHWGSRITVRDRDVVAPAEDRIRLQPLLEDGRTILKQPIITEEGIKLGMCRDVQFDTKTMRLTWLFPRKWFRWRMAIPRSEIVEVRDDAIIVRDPPAAEAQPAAKADPAEALERLQEIADTGIAPS